MSRVSLTMTVCLLSLASAATTRAQGLPALQLPPNEAQAAAPAEPLAPRDDGPPPPSTELASNLASNGGQPSPALSADPSGPPSIVPQGAPNGAAPLQPSQLILDPNQTTLPAYFSPRLGARFVMQPMFLPQFGQFLAARMVSPPQPGSPLQMLGLREGDAITRLDGIPLQNVVQLEQHILQTDVRFIRHGQQHVERGIMYICPHEYFFERVPPICHTPGCGRTVLRP